MGVSATGAAVNSVLALETAMPYTTPTSRSLRARRPSLGLALGADTHQLRYQTRISTNYA